MKRVPTKLWEREVRRSKGIKEGFAMLTERRPVQLPHLTLTTIDKLLYGTFTCSYNIILLLIQHFQTKTTIYNFIVVWSYQQYGATKTTLHIANLFGGVGQELFQCGRHINALLCTNCKQLIKERWGALSMSVTQRQLQFIADFGGRIIISSFSNTLLPFQLMNSLCRFLTKILLSFNSIFILICFQPSTSCPMDRKEPQVVSITLNISLKFNLTQLT